MVMKVLVWNRNGHTRQGMDKWQRQHLGLSSSVHKIWEYVRGKGSSNPHARKGSLVSTSRWSVWSQDLGVLMEDAWGIMRDIIAWFTKRIPMSLLGFLDHGGRKETQGIDIEIKRWLSRHPTTNTWNYDREKWCCINYQTNSNVDRRLKIIMVKKMNEQPNLDIGSAFVTGFTP